MVTFLCEIKYITNYIVDYIEKYIWIKCPPPSNENNITILIKYPIVKRYPTQKESMSLQTHAEEDLRSRSDFVFAASTDWARAEISTDMRISDIPCLSNNRLTCAVARSSGSKSNRFTNFNDCCKESMELDSITADDGTNIDFP